MVDTLGLVNAVTGAPSYNGRKLRQLNGVGFAGATAARPLGVRSGVRPGTPSTTVTATSTTWTCQPFAGLIDGHTAAEAGGFPFAFDAVATGAVTAASASIARVDIMYVQVDDPAESDGSSVPAVTRKYLAGTVASTPPTLPARSILLAHINVPISGGGAPTVIWKAPYCAAAGGVVDFNTKAELDAWTTAAPQQRAFVSGDGITYRFNGAAWKGWDSDWITYTPTLTGIAVGTGGSALASARYKYSSGMVVVDFAYVLGASGFTAPSVPEVTLPVTARAAKHPYVTYAGDLSVYDVSPGINYPGKVVASSSAVDKVRLYSTNAGAFANIGASVPFSWAAGDALAGQFTYEPA